MKLNEKKGSKFVRNESRSRGKKARGHFLKLGKYSCWKTKGIQVENFRNDIVIQSRKSQNKVPANFNMGM